MNYSYFVGLDVGKKSFDASLMSSDEEELGLRRFANSESGIQPLPTSFLQTRPHLSKSTSNILVFGDGFM